MQQRKRLTRLAAGAGVLALVVAGGVALAQPGDDAGDGAEQRIVRDESTFEVAWLDADGRTGVETITLDLSDAPDEASSDPSPPGATPRRPEPRALSVDADQLRLHDRHYRRAHTPVTRVLA